MPQIVLNRPGIVSLVGKLETAGVAQHVGVHGEAELGLVSGATDDLPHRGIGHCASTLRRKDVGRHHMVAP